MKRQAICYLAKNLINNKLYIGITLDTLENRIKGHIKGGSRFHDALMKHGIDNFDWEILKDDFPTRRHAEIYEILAIWFYGTFLGCKLYNLTVGGDGTCGYKMRDEQKRLLSDATKKQWIENREQLKKALKLKWSDPEYKKRMKPIRSEAAKRMWESESYRENYKNSHTGKKKSPETAAKISASNTGKKRSPETIAKIIESNKRRKGEKRKLYKTCSRRD